MHRQSSTQIKADLHVILAATTTESAEAQVEVQPAAFLVGACDSGASDKKFEIQGILRRVGEAGKKASRCSRHPPRSPGIS